MYIMVVDDAGLARKSIIKILSATKKYNQIVEAEDGKQAVRLYKQYAPSIVFMDLLMPKMSGIDALEKIMKIDSHANVIVFSSLGQESVIEQAIALGAKDYLIKPFSSEKVISAIENILEED